MDDQKVEERVNAERVDLQRMEQQRQAQRSMESAKAFQAMMQNVAKNEGASKSKKESEKRQERQSQDTVSQKLSAKKGIHIMAQSVALKDRNQRKDEKQKSMSRSDSNRKEVVRTRQQSNAEQAKANQPIVGSGSSSRNSGGNGADSQRDKKRDNSSRQQNAEGLATLSGQAPNQMVFQLGQIGSHIGQSNLPQNQGMRLKEIIDTLVSAVHQEISTKGLHIFHIELKGSVLSGTSVTVQQSEHSLKGIAVQIDTPNQNLRRLLCDSDNVRTLTQSFAGKKLQLDRLIVNHQKVLGY